ncbi:MAG TPA: type II secretion system protein GspK, partial [Polyangiaceae bacterium]|nr:type II secretion system protein GspK [Polyangiaceae bacterium]
AQKPALRRWPRRSRRQQQRGVALVLVLGALTIMTVMLTEFQDETSAELGSALSERDALKAEYAAKSALNLSRLLIAAEPTIRTSPVGMLLAMMNGGRAPPQIPVWEFADRVLGAFNDAAASAEFSSFTSVNLAEGKNLGLADAGFEVDIVDEDSKININTAARASTFANVQLAGQLIGLMAGAQYDSLFEARDAQGQFSDRFAICSAIVDWTDLDQDSFVCDTQSATAQNTAAEDSYYELLKQPYSRKNAAFDSLEELRLVRGINDDFWSTFVDPDPDNPDKRILTVWGQGKVNVNTANARTLFALICSTEMAPDSPICKDPAESMKFLSLVSMVRGFTAGAPIFGSPRAFVRGMQGRGQLFKPIFEMLHIKPVLWKSEDVAIKHISTESQMFSIYATGYVRSGKRETRVRLHSVVDFRGAPPPGQEKAAMVENLLGAAGGTGGSGGQPSTQQPTQTTPGQDPNQANLPEGATPDAIAGALQPSPGGNIVYFRLD